MKLFPAVENSICGQAAAGSMASKALPRLVVSFWGGRSLKFPVGASANGIPANFSTFPEASPTTVSCGEMATCGPVARSSITGVAGKLVAGAASVIAPMIARIPFILHRMLLKLVLQELLR